MLKWNAGPNPIGEWGREEGREMGNICAFAAEEASPSIKGSEWGDPSFLRPPSKHLPMHCQRPKSGIRARVREVLGSLARLSLVPPSLHLLLGEHIHVMST